MTRKIRRWRRSRLRWLLEYGVVLGIQTMIAPIPRSMRLRVGHLLGFLARVVLPSRRRMALRNLELAYPEQGAAWRNAVARGSFRHLGRLGVEVLFLDSLIEDVEVEGWEHLEAVASDGAPYGSQSDQSPLGGYGQNEYSPSGSSQDEDHGFSQSRNRQGGRRFLSSTDLSSNYQGHYRQPRYGSVGNSSGFGTGQTSMRSRTTPTAGQTTSDRNLFDSSSENDSSLTRPSYRGLGPKGFQRSDERIREMVSETLEDHHDIDASDIEVQVASGEVTLTGTVSDRSTERLAEDVIEFFPGVRDVTNNLKVKRGMFGKMADSIQHALGVDDDEEETSRSTSSRSGSSGRGTSRSKR